MKQITLSELPEPIQQLLNQIQQTGEPLTVTKEGMPLVIVYPAIKPERAAFGCLKCSGEILGDIVEPALDLSAWEVLQ